MSVNPHDHHRKYDGEPIKHVPLSTHQMRYVLREFGFASQQHFDKKIFDQLENETDFTYLRKNHQKEELRQPDLNTFSNLGSEKLASVSNLGSKVKFSRKGWLKKLAYHGETELV